MIKKGYEEKKLEALLEKLGVFDINIQQIDVDANYDYCIVYNFEGEEIFKVTALLYEKLCN
jgi:hypothetical protein